MVKKPECITCGLCCSPHQQQQGFANVTQRDIKRLGAPWVKKNVQEEAIIDGLAALIMGPPYKAPGALVRTKNVVQRSGPFKGKRLCVCTALQGSLLKRVTCSIYDKRPAVCRTAVKPGDPNCQVLRKEFLDEKL